MKPTEKQIVYVKRIVDYLGEEKVLSYVRKHFPTVETIEGCNRKQMQKIIEGLAMRLPSKPIYGIHYPNWILNDH